MYMFVEHYHWGWLITSSFGGKMKFVYGYTKKQAIKEYRHMYGMERKHISVIEM